MISKGTPCIKTLELPKMKNCYIYLQNTNKYIDMEIIIAKILLSFYKIL